MRILLVIPSIGNIYGGPSKIVLGLAKALGRQGKLVDIVTTNVNGEQVLDVPLNEWINELGYRIQYFPCFDLSDYKWSNIFASWLFSHVQDYDLVHTNAIFSLSNLPAHWACQWHNVPYIMTPHGMLEPWALSYKAWKKQFYYRILERFALNKASAIQATASPEAKHLQRLGLTTSIVTIPNGVYESEFNALPDADIFYQKFPLTRGKLLVLFLGRIDPKKGLDLLAKAFSSVRLHCSQVHLVIAGPDNIGFLPTAQNYFETLGCSEAVTFTGMLSGNLKYSAITAADIYIAPSYSEGFSMSILEAMASGLPCIITTGCNFPEAGEEKAAYVVASKAEEIADALLFCLTHRDEARRTGHLARKFILENYTWEKVAEKLIALYQEILLGRNSKVC